MTRYILVLPFALLSVAVFADTCPKCFEEIRPTDNYCPGCRHDLVEWRRSLQAPKPEPVEPRPIDPEPVVREPQRTDDGSVTPFELSLIGPVGIPGGFFDSVTGLQLSLIYGDSEIMKGIQVGLIQCDTEMYGLQVGFWNWVSREGEGLQLGCFNWLGTDGSKMRGLQIGLLDGAERMSGFQCGYLNGAEQELNGVQVGLINNPPDGIRCDVCGLQIGLLNSARNMTGVQVGLINIIVESPIPFFPFVNMHF